MTRSEIYNLRDRLSQLETAMYDQNDSMFVELDRLYDQLELYEIEAIAAERTSQKQVNFNRIFNDVKRCEF